MCDRCNSIAMMMMMISDAIHAVVNIVFTKFFSGAVT